MFIEHMSKSLEINLTHFLSPKRNHKYLPSQKMKERGIAISVEK